MGWLNNAHSFTASVFRGTRGLFANKPAAIQPEQPLELYEFEACPYCRKVREVLSEMDLEYIARPCARGSSTREKVIGIGGKRMFPYFVDPNTGTEMYESEDIITCLMETYGSGRSRLSRAVSPLNSLTSSLASWVRPRGMFAKARAKDRAQPAKLLELYNFEASPYCRKAREALCSHNLDYLVHNVAKGSARRPELVERGGRMMVPYLIDPNTGTEMYESDDIVLYLGRVYG